MSNNENENSKMITQEQFLDFKNDVNRRFDQVDGRHTELKADVNRRFDQVDKNHAEFKADVNRRFDQVEGRQIEFKNDVDRRFDKLQNWMVGTSVTVVGVVLAAIGTYGVFLFQAIDNIS